MSSLLLGFSLILVSSVASGVFGVALRRRRVFSVELMWLIVFLTGYLLLPHLLVMLALPGWDAALGRAGFAGLAPGILFGLAWGVASLLFAHGIAVLGVSLGYAIIMGLIIAVGSSLPLLRHWGAVAEPTRAAAAVGIALISDTGNTSHGDTAYHFSCGVYLDNWTSNCLVYGNLVVNEAVGVAVKGRNNIVQNNLFVGAGDCGIALHSHASYPEHAALVSNNIFYGGSPQAALLKIADRKPRRRVLWQCDCNLCFRPGDPDPVIGRSESGDAWRIAAWREMSSREGEAYDANSVIADPLFVDAAHGDYRLRPDSPALALGFVPIPFERIGTRKTLAP